MWYNDHAGRARQCFPSEIDECQESLLNGGFRLKVYYVVYSFGSYYREHTHVYAESKREVRKIMKSQFGSRVVIHEIEKEEY